MSVDSVRIIKAGEVAELLHGAEREVMDLVSQAYQLHASGQSVLPHSLFLRLPPSGSNRIIALPAYLGSPFEVAGLKWISSFPQNINNGVNRASALVVLNSIENGRPEVILEGSIISLKRTAASAVLAANLLHGPTRPRIGFIGCGVINFEILRFLSVTQPVEEVYLLDTSVPHAERFRQRAAQFVNTGAIRIVNDVHAVLSECALVSVATTASGPHIFDLSACQPGSTILNISLRDFSAHAILKADNVVDDPDHVCREQTSVHCAEQLAGNRDFIRATLAEVLTGVRPSRSANKSTLVFSPFGLGVLDLVLAKFVSNRAIESGLGTTIDSFLADFWSADSEADSPVRAAQMTTASRSSH